QLGGRGDEPLSLSGVSSNRDQAASAAGSGIGVAVACSPWVFGARIAITAATARKIAASSSASWSPAVSASAWDARWARSPVVVDVATAEKIAMPSAPPSHIDALI